jgi:8-oxo-dGTP pyrophosphatase MutT (NUDIX family)
LVGGKVESGETVAQALVREIGEEIGSCITDPKLMPIEKFAYHTFLIVVDAEFIPILNEEHRGYAWVPLDNYPKPLHPGVWRTFNFKSIIKKLKTVEQIKDQLLTQNL